MNPAEQSLSYRVNYANTIVYICLRNPTGVRRNGLELDGVIMEPQRTQKETAVGFLFLTVDVGFF